jgi:hypothetical protein
MQSSNLAERIELANSDQLSQPSQRLLRVITNNEPVQVRNVRPRLSLEFRAIVIRDQGFRAFRVY